jgi:DNA primase
MQNGRIPRSFLEMLLERTDIVGLIGKHVQLRRSGTNYFGLCPFHKEKTPSFSVIENKKRYHCFGCGASGDAMQFLMEHDGLSFVDAATDLAEKLGLVIPYENAKVNSKHSALEAQQLAARTTISANTGLDGYAVLQRAQQYFQQQLTATSPATAYLVKRGLSPAVIEEFALGYAPNVWNGLYQTLGQHETIEVDMLLNTGLIVANKEQEQRYYDRFRHRIIFPIRDTRGRVLGFGGRVLDQGEPKYLNSPETAWFHKSKQLYGMYELHKKQKHPSYVVVVEGYLDVIALAQYDFPQAVATLGTALTEEHMQQLLRLSPKVVFCFDGDVAGKKAALRAMEMALACMQDGYTLKFMFLPSQLDPDSFLRTQGREAFAAALDKAVLLEDLVFNHLLEGADLQGESGRAAVFKRGKELLSKLPVSSYKTMLQVRLKQVLRLDTATIEQQPRGPSAPLRPGNKRYGFIAPKCPAWLAVALLCEQPNLLALLPAELIMQCRRASEINLRLLAAVAEQLQANQNSSISEIVQQLPSALARLLVVAELKAAIAIIPSEGRTAEFLGACKQLKHKCRADAIQALTQKAKDQALSLDDKVQLQNMLREQQQ